MSKVGIFVDVSNCFYNINKRWPDRKLNYDCYIKQALRTSGQVEASRAIAYGTQVEDTARKFISCLNILGFEPKYKTIEKGQWYSWDVGIAVDMIRNCENLDTIILGNSSRHMVPVVQFLQEKGVKVIVIACGIPRELRECCSKWVEIEEEMLEPVS